jgi:hypothetical protein
VEEQIARLRRDITGETRQSTMDTNGIVRRIRLVLILAMMFSTELPFQVRPELL